MSRRLQRDTTSGPEPVEPEWPHRPTSIHSIWSAPGETVLADPPRERGLVRNPSRYTAVTELFWREERERWAGMSSDEQFVEMRTMIAEQKARRK